MVAADFDVAVMNTSMTSKSIEKEQSHTDASIKDLIKFDPDDFEMHEDAFFNLLAQTSGAVNESIRYIARESIAPAAFMDEREERMF